MGVSAKKVALMLGVIIVVFFAVFVGGHKKKSSERKGVETLLPRPVFEIQSRAKEAEVGRLSKKVETLESQLKNTDEALKTLSEEVEGIRQAITGLTETLAKTKAKSFPEGKLPLPPKLGKTDEVETALPDRIEVVPVPEPEKEEVKTKQAKKTPEKRTFLYLPAGAMVPATLVTGVYAPIYSGKTLPTILTVDEAFYGPNRTRVPLRGCVVLARARGRGLAERAEISPVLLSCVLPDGSPLEMEVSGYVADATDRAGGVKGKLDRQTWKVMRNSLLVSMLETLENMAVSSQSQNAVTGVSKAAEKMAEYEGRILDQLVPSVKVDAGRKVYLVLSKGVVLNGYTPDMAVAAVDSSFGLAASAFHGLD